jgi:shikimate kinase
MITQNRKKRKKPPQARLRYPLPKSIFLVGLMGAGKTTVGVRLARRLGLTFMDSDAEIESAAGHSVSEIFEKFGEDDFRAGERRVINRLISENKIVLGTGGGAFMDSKTRRRLREKTISIWLKVNIDVLVERTGRRNTRPLLKTGNPEEILRNLAKKRYPLYGHCAITIESNGGPHEKIVDDIIRKLNEYLKPKGAASEKKHPSGQKNKNPASSKNRTSRNYFKRRPKKNTSSNNKEQRANNETQQASSEEAKNPKRSAGTEGTDKNDSATRKDT